MDRRPKSVHLTEEERNRLRELLGSGMNPTHAARQMGCDPRTARREAKILKARGLAPAARYVRPPDAILPL